MRTPTITVIVKPVAPSSSRGDDREDGRFRSTAKTTTAKRNAPVQPTTRPDVLEVFAARAEARAYLWAEGEIDDLHEAVDKLQADAERDRLVDRLGQDRIQAILAKAFAAVRKPYVVESTAIPTVEKVPDLVAEKPRRERAPAATVDALIYALRHRGEAALGERDTRQRLGDLSTDQVRDVIGRLIKLRPKCRTIDDDLLLKLGRLL